MGNNQFAYCGNNPVNRIDPTGEAWYHWALGALVVAGFAALTIATCGGSVFAAASAVGMVASGATAFSAASTVAAAAFIGSATAFGIAATDALLTSDTVEDFYDKGNWGTVGITATGAGLGAATVYSSARNYSNLSYNYNGAKKPEYVDKRGWDGSMINLAIRSGKQGTSINMANGAPCSVYCYPGASNQYIVIEDQSRCIVQVSNFNIVDWVPDPRIMWNP